jgi:AraC family transcriptional regulator
LDDSKVCEARTFKGLEIELHRFAGARALRVVHPGAQQIEEHSHDWAYIGLYTSGRYRERYDGGEADMRGPCAVLHPAGRPHADMVEVEGLETPIEFDPAWLRAHGFTRRLDRSRLWSGGAVALASRSLSAALSAPSIDERALGRATAEFLSFALTAEAHVEPAWVKRARDLLEEDSPANAAGLARSLDLHPAYLARAYRAATGEGVGETQRRRRVEAASALLRQTALPLADIAIASGFCDQSHMNRCFSAVLGRTPRQVRHERQLFDERSAASA